MFWERRVIFGLAAYKAHASFGPGEDAIKHFSKELADVKTGKGTMQIPYDKPLPEKLVRRIARFCISDESDEQHVT